MTRAFVGLGSNLDDPPVRLKEACAALAALEHICLAARSPVYRTEPQGNRDQPWFHNQVVALECGTEYSAFDLLAGLLALETRLGRQRTADRFGPRRIDLDLLLFGNETCESERLTLPHPRMFERAFVLIPLRDIAPDLVFPDGSDIQQRLDALDFHAQGCTVHQ